MTLTRRFLLVILLTLGVGQGDDSARQLQGRLYEPLIFNVDIDPTLYANPFDTQDIELVGVFRAPSGKEQVIPGFWMQPYADRCVEPCVVENLQPAGQPVWQIRFTPQETGSWSYTIFVRDSGVTVSSDTGQFTVQESGLPGFIRTAPNRRYFQYQNGQPYFPIGHNLNWSWEGGGGLYVYQKWLRDLRAAGGNYARLYIDVPWFIGLEWNRPAGNYSAAQIDAARLDAILQTAAENGIALQLVVVWSQSLQYYSDPPVLIPADPARPVVTADWDNHPYNVLNGGPLSGPGVFYFNEQARDLIRRRLHYIVARWGYSPNVLAWELIDEVDTPVNFETNIADVWVQSMASYVRQIDQHGHLITAGSRGYDALLAANPLLDFTQARFFQRRPLETTVDQIKGVLETLRRNLRANNVPTLLTAFSLNPWFEPTNDDPQGIHLQNTLWASVFSGAAGGAFSAWGDTYVEPQRLSRYYPPLAAFVANVDWARLDLRPVEAGLLFDDQRLYQPVRVSEFNRQFTVIPAASTALNITADGVFPSAETVSAYLYGNVYNSQFKQEHIFYTAPPVDTYFEVRISATSRDYTARLQIILDDAQVTELELPPNSRGVTLRLPLSAGEHTLVLDNVGDDWLLMEYIEVGRLYGPARALTLRDSAAGVALAWLHHRDYVWDKVAAGVERQAVEPRYRLDKMPPGRYRVELWDPLSGVVLGEEITTVQADGVLTVDLLAFDSEIALRVFRQSDLPESSPMPVLPTATRTPAPTLTATLSPTATPRRLLIATNTPRPAATAAP